MAKNKFNPADKLKEADKKHDKNTEQYVKIVSALYNKAIEDLSELALMIKDFGEDEDFSFDKNPNIAKKAEEVVKKLSERISAVVDSGSRSEWLGACKKSDEFIDSVLNTSKLTKKTLQSYKDRNIEALAAFQERKVDGLNLSERVWKMVEPMKDEVELAVDTSNKYYKNGINSSKSLTKIDRALGKGTSAAELSRDVRSCLLEPNKLFRRVRDKHGNLVLSKAAKLYHPGQGVYRSSYKNAMRLTRTEINMAYRQSDHLRWQQLDFVVGMKIQTSNNHTTTDPHSNGTIELHDLCDRLAGNYPKEFKFVGWHPQCRCFATPIMKTLEEVDKDVDADGNYTNLPSANQVYDVPDNFKDYVAENEERMKGWKYTPYYLKDNPQYVDEALHPDKYIKKPLVLDQDTFKRLSDYEMYGFNHQRSTLFNEALVKAKMAQLEGDLAAFEAAMEEMGKRKKKNDISAVSHEKKKKIEEEEKKRIEESKKTFEKLSNDNNYINVVFNQDNGGLMAMHVDHTLDRNKGWYETETQRIGFEYGNVVILEKEDHTVLNRKNVEGTWNGMKFEIGGAENGSKNNVRNALKHCAKKPDCEVAIVFLPNGYNMDDIEKGIAAYQGLKNDEKQWKAFKGGIVFIGDNKIIKHYLQPELAEVAGATGVCNNAVTFHRVANVVTNNKSSKKSVQENDKSVKNDDVLKLSYAKNNVNYSNRKKRIDPKEYRHKFDSRIDVIRKWKDAYDLDESKIEYEYMRASIAGIEVALSEQESLLDSRKKQVKEELDRLVSIGGDAKPFNVEETGNYKIVMMKIEREIKRIEEFNSFYTQSKGSIDITMYEGEMWGVKQSYIDDLNEYVSTKNTFGVKDRMRIISREVQKIKSEYESYKKIAKEAIDDAKALGLDHSGVELQLITLEKHPESWKNVKNTVLKDVNALIDESKRVSSGDMPNPALKKEYKTNEEVDKTFKQIQENLPDNSKWFEHGDLVLKVEVDLSCNGSTNMMGKIQLTSRRLISVRSALGKIAQGKSDDITFEEADAMATFWHEITHNRNIHGNVYTTIKQTRYMELANEFTARKSLGEFYGVLGCKVVPHPEFMQNRDSTGYNKWVLAYDHVIDVCRLDRNTVTSYIRNHLFNDSYKDQESTLKDALIEGGLKKIDGGKIKKIELKAIVDKCLMKPTIEQMDEMLRNIGFIE